MDIGDIERKTNLSTGGSIAIGVGFLVTVGLLVLFNYCDNDCEKAKGE